MQTKGKLVVLKLDGELQQQGFRVTLEIGPDGDRPLIETVASLPPNPALAAQLDEWQQAYRSLGMVSRIMPQEILYGGSVNWRETCQRQAHELRDRLNHWLESSPFRPIDRRLREALQLQESIRVLIRTENAALRRLPWHLWDFVEHYTQAEVALSALTVERFERAKEVTPKAAVRVLAIFGNRTGIDLGSDRQTLEQLPNAAITFLIEPQRQQINQQLWDQPWDILFFAGHSQTEGTQGRLYLNAHESLTLEELTYGLRRAIAQGLQLAIFNSCDGLGLAQALEPLHLPQLIVMREPVPDRVAQAFLKDFLTAFVEGDSLYLATRQARERLQGLEGQFPCASWLPVICQNSLELPLDWQGLLGRDSEVLTATSINVSTLAAIVFTDVEGFTRKLATDETHTLSLLQRDLSLMRELCQQHEGRVLKTLGDGLLLYFASAERAVSCAIEMQARLATAALDLPEEGILRHRIGIHLGDVAFSGDDVLGSGVNIAARLQHEAPPGGICLSRTVYEVVKSHLTLPIKDGGLRTLKGIPESLKVYLIPSPYVVPAWTDRRKHDRAQGLRQVRSRLWKHGGLVLLTSSIITGAVMGLRWLGSLQPAELWAFDRLMQLRPAETLDDRLLLITVDEADLKYQNQQKMTWRGSLSDQALNQLLAKLKPYQPTAIGLDIYRDFPVAADQPALKTRLRDLIGICTIGGISNTPVAAPPELTRTQLGFADVPLDGDRVVRRHTLGKMPGTECRTDKSLSYQLALRYWQRHKIQSALIDQVLHVGNLQLPKLSAFAGGYRSSEFVGYDVLLNYRASRVIAPQIPLTAILNGSMDSELPDLIHDRLILIGTIARSFKDYAQTPYGELAGVEIQAHMVSQLLSWTMDGRPMLQCWTPWGDGLWIVGWAAVGGMFVIGHRSIVRLVLLDVGSAGCLCFVCFVLLLQGVWAPLIPPLLAMLASSSIIWFKTSEV